MNRILLVVNCFVQYVFLQKTTKCDEWIHSKRIRQESWVKGLMIGEIMVDNQGGAFIKRPKHTKFQLISLPKEIIITF